MMEGIQISPIPPLLPFLISILSTPKLRILWPGPCRRHLIRRGKVQHFGKSREERSRNRETKERREKKRRKRAEFEFKISELRSCPKKKGHFSIVRNHYCCDDLLFREQRDEWMGRDGMMFRVSSLGNSLQEKEAPRVCKFRRLPEGFRYPSFFSILSSRFAFAFSFSMIISKF